MRRGYNMVGYQSWLFRMFAPVLNRLDFVAQRVFRTSRDVSLPAFSSRVRGHGISRQFGGRRFVESGDKLVAFVEDRGIAHERMSVVDLGCGAGRIGLALQRRFRDFSYSGIDVDAVSIGSAQSSIANDRLVFRHENIYNSVYNPRGTELADSARFASVSDGSVDLVVAWSLFTHVEPETTRHYLREIGRMLKPGGHVVFSCFLHDGRDHVALSHPHPYRDAAYVANESQPLKSVSLCLGFVESALAEARLESVDRPLRMHEHAVGWGAKGPDQDVVVAARSRADYHPGEEVG